MDGQPAVYLGRIVSKLNFRAFIHAPAGHKKLVNSWDEFERHMASGIWFDTEEKAKDAAIAAVEPDVIEELIEEVQEAPKKRVTKAKKALETKEDIKSDEPALDESFAQDPTTFEVKNDDFLSDARK